MAFAQPSPALICPRCGRGSARSARPSSRSLSRCGVHNLALVSPEELEKSKNDPLLGQTVAGRFTVLGRLGHGSMGAVYRARQEAVGRDIALKIVRRDRAYDPETKVRFEREARATCALASPHTVTAFDFGEAQDGSWFLAMELLEGESLGTLIRRDGRVPWERAIRFTREALKSLAEAHSKGIIHRDLKPDNLFLAKAASAAGGEPTQVCKILDFGIAKLIRGDGERVDQLETQAGTVFGTPRYMSPEQAQGLPLDPRSDLYSLGVILYQMLIGRAPFVDDDAVVVMARHIKDPPPKFATVAPDVQIPEAIERVVARVLSKDPDQRPQRADDFIAELDAAIEEHRATSSGAQAAVQAVTVDQPSDVLNQAPVGQRPRRRRLGAALGALAGVTVVSLAIFSNPSDWAPSRSDTPARRAQAARPVPPPLRRRVVADADAGARKNARQHTDAATPAPASGGARKRPSASPAESAQRGWSVGLDLPRKANERYGRFQ